MVSAASLVVLAELAEEQWGLFTRQQAAASGMAWSTLARLAADGATLERVAHGVYRLRGAPPADHLHLRAAWLQLAPGVPGWQRTAEAGVVSHRSAASVYQLGHLPADVYEFTLPRRRQTRRHDVRLHRGQVPDNQLHVRAGLPVTSPARTAADLLTAREDPGAVGHIIADALRAGHDNAAGVAQAVAPLASRFGLPRGDGPAILDWLVELTDAPEQHAWVEQARQARTGSQRAA